MTQTLISGFNDTSLPIAVTASLKRLLVGYLTALILGSLLGIALAKSRLLEESIGFLILSLQTVPSIVWLPLAILWFGLSDTAVIFVVIIGALWTMVITVKSAVQNVPPLLLRAARTLGYRSWRLFFQVVLPASLPELITGLRLSWAFAWRSLMAGELLGSGTGLGQVLMIGRNLGDMSLVLSVMIIISLLGALIDLLFFRRLEIGVLQKRGLTTQTQ